MALLPSAAPHPASGQATAGTPQHTHRFVTLDMLRGIAAIAVVCFHTSALFHAQLFQHGYLAVDFFFMLSGFVLMSAYARRLSAGWPTFTFIRTRFARLYPLYLLGLLLGFLFPLSYHLISREHILTAPVTAFLLGLAFLPTLTRHPGSGGYLYPLNTPTWSLFLELCVNLFQAALLRRPTTRRLLGIVLVSACALVLAVLHLRTMEFGQDQKTFLFGFLRVLFAYTAGMLLFVFWQKGVLRLRWPAAASAGVLALLLAVPTSPACTPTYDVTVTLIGFPLLLLLSASTKAPASLATAFLLLGDTSYAIYVLHVPALAWFIAITSRTPLLRRMHAPWIGFLYLVATCLLALMVDTYYDRPARSRLRRYLAA